MMRTVDTSEISHDRRRKMCSDLQDRIQHNYQWMDVNGKAEGLLVQLGNAILTAFVLATCVVRTGQGASKVVQHDRGGCDE